MSDPDRLKYGFGDYGVTEISHCTIPLADGTKLAARLCIPDTKSKESGKFSEKFSTFNDNKYSRVLIASNPTKQPNPTETFPVIMEYLPYYKDYYTASRDHSRHPWLASHGFVSMRLEMRGSGASEGFYYGEYLIQVDLFSLSSFCPLQSYYYVLPIYAQNCSKLRI